MYLCPFNACSASLFSCLQCSRLFGFFNSAVLCRLPYFRKPTALRLLFVFLNQPPSDNFFAQNKWRNFCTNTFALVQKSRHFNPQRRSAPVLTPTDTPSCVGYSLLSPHHTQFCRQCQSYFSANRIYAAFRTEHLKYQHFAETVGFEPTCRLPDNRISSAARYDHFDTSPIYEFRTITGSDFKTVLNNTKSRRQNQEI